MTADHLSGIIERLERAAGPSAELDHEIVRAICEYEGRPYFAATAQPPYTSSIDAALTLVPEGEWIDMSGPRKYLNIPSPVPNFWLVRLPFAGKKVIYGWGATLPLAIVSAALRARSHKAEG